MRRIQEDKEPNYCAADGCFLVAHTNETFCTLHKKAHEQIHKEETEYKKWKEFMERYQYETHVYED